MAILAACTVKPKPAKRLLGIKTVECCLNTRFLCMDEHLSHSLVGGTLNDF